MRQRKRSTLKCDAPDRGDETRGAHACTFLVDPDGGAWGCLELPEDGRHGQSARAGVADRGVAQAPKFLIARNFGEPSKMHLGSSSLLRQLALKAGLDLKCLRH